jgi:hypothetical protein
LIVDRSKLRSGGWVRWWEPLAAERLIGTGGMAAVYAGTREDGTTAAVKMLHPEMTLKRDVRERFVREGYVGNRVQHPGAVRIIEHGESEGEAFLVMELLEGEPLGECVRRLGGLPFTELSLLDQVLDVLAARAQNIRRDIKPDNIHPPTVVEDPRPGWRECRRRAGDQDTHRLALNTFLHGSRAMLASASSRRPVDVFALGATHFASCPAAVHGR